MVHTSQRNDWEMTKWEMPVENGCEIHFDEKKPG